MNLFYPLSICRLMTWAFFFPFCFLLFVRFLPLFTDVSCLPTFKGTYQLISVIICHVTNDDITDVGDQHKGSSLSVSDFPWTVVWSNSNNISPVLLQARHLSKKKIHAQIDITYSSPNWCRFVFAVFKPALNHTAREQVRDNLGPGKIWYHF